MVGLYRGEAKVIGIDGSAPERFRKELRCRWRLRWGCRSAGQARGQVFVRVNQVLVRLWAYLLVCLTGCAVLLGAASSEQGNRSDDDCCVLSKSDLR